MEKNASTRDGFFSRDHEAPRAAGALVYGEGYTPSADGTVIYFSVQQDIDELLNLITQHRGIALTQKISIGEHGNIAHFLDTEGNKLALHTSD